MEAEARMQAAIVARNHEIVLFRKVGRLCRRIQIGIGRGLEQHGKEALAVHRRGPLPGIGVHAVPDSLHGDGGDVLHVDDRAGLDLAEAVIEVHDPELFEDLVPQLFDALGRVLFVGPQGEHGADGLFMAVAGDIMIGLAVGRLEIHAVHVDGQGKDMFRRMLQHPVHGAAGQIVAGRTGLGQQLVQLAGEDTAHLRADRHLVARGQLFHGSGQAEHGRDAELAGQGEQARAQQAVLGDDGPGTVHQRSPLVQIALHHQDAAVRKIQDIRPGTGDDHRAAGPAAAGGDAAGQQGRGQVVIRAGLGLVFTLFLGPGLDDHGTRHEHLRPAGRRAQPDHGLGTAGHIFQLHGQGRHISGGLIGKGTAVLGVMHTSGADFVRRGPGNMHHVDGHQRVFHVLRQPVTEIDMDVTALQVDGVGRMGHAAKAVLLHGKAGDADAGIGFHQAAGTPVNQGLGLLLAGQRRMQGSQDIHIGRMQGDCGAPDQQPGIRARRVLAVIHAGPQAPFEQQAHRARTFFAQLRQRGTKFFHQPVR